MDPGAGADPSPSRRSLKRRPPARSPELLSPTSTGDAEAELIRRVEELEAAAARLREEKEAAEQAARAMQEELAEEEARRREERMAAEETARALQKELDMVRASADSGTNEAMLMIERLQREKAAAQMEARQFRRYTEGHAQVQEQLASYQELAASYQDLAASYHSRLLSHGIDPDSFSDEEEELVDVEEGGDAEQGDASNLAAERDAGDASTRSELKDMFFDGVDKDEQRSSPSSPVEKEFEYTVDVPCTTKAVGAMVVTEYVGDGNAGGLYARVEALEADRVALRRELAALRAERAQLVMAREMARRLCWEMVAEQRAIVKKTAAPAGSFSMLGVCKSTMFTPWRRLPRPQR